MSYYILVSMDVVTLATTKFTHASILLNYMYDVTLRHIAHTSTNDINKVHDTTTDMTSGVTL